jgi:Flp pilus assembly protein TadG
VFNKMRKLYKEEKGGAAVLFAFGVVVMLGMSGLVIDGGNLYQTRSHLKKTADSAVLSGAQEVMSNEAAVKGVVNTILKANKEQNSLEDMKIRPNGENKLTVSLKRDVSTYFMKLFRIPTVPVSATSSAAIAPLSRAAGAVPLGIRNDVQLEYLKEYRLKVDAGDGVSGGYGVLALSGTGANLYEQDLMYGYNGDISVGQIIPTQTGNIEGKTRSSVNFRISSSPYTLDDYAHKDDPRVIMILIYEPHQMDRNQMKSVKVCGFAYFYLRQPMSHQDSEIVGYFIQRIGAGSSDPTLRDTGAYAIRLVE